MPHAPEPPEDLDPADAAVIRQEVEVFCSRHHFRWSDEDDLFQECAIRWLQVVERHDQERASRQTYLKAVVRNHLKDLWKAEHAYVRMGHAGAMSLDEPLTGENEETTLGDLLPACGDGPDAAATWHVSLDRIQGRLSERQRAMIRGVLSDYSMAELARELGVNRDTLYQDRRRIQEVFVEEGLSPPDLDPTDRRARS